MQSKIILTALAVAAAASFAQADTVNLQFTGTGSGRTIKATLGTSTFNCFAGQLKHTFSSGTGVAAGLTGSKVTFCSDLSEYVSSSGSTYTVTPIANLPVSSGWPAMGAVRAQAVYDLYAAANAQQTATGANSDYAAAFQIALWEVVYDYTGSAGSLNLGSGNLKIKDSDGSTLTSAIANHVTQLFSMLGANTVQDGLMGLAKDGKQDQIYQFQVVPLPAALPLGLAGLGLVAWNRRRANRA